MAGSYAGAARNHMFPVISRMNVNQCVGFGDEGWQGADQLPPCVISFCHNQIQKHSEHPQHTEAHMCLHIAMVSMDVAMAMSHEMNSTGQERYVPVKT
jgi:hypothetical protein